MTSGTTLTAGTSGHGVADLMLHCEATEGAGVRAALTCFEMAGDSGTEFGFVTFSDKADAVVSTGNMDEVVELPPMDRVIGGETIIDIGNYEGGGGAQASGRLKTALRRLYCCASLIADIVQREPIRSQEQLRRKVKAAGFDVTQATLSRDIRELGLVKGGADAAYLSPTQQPVQAPGAAPQLQRAVSEYLARVDRVQQMLLLRTGPGQAQLLGVALDRARLPEVVGTIAGDDTILVIAPDVRRARALVKRLEGFSSS